ncbi:adenylate cyclase type 3 isoform X1 [Pieris napi]|uniref:adenylate cyclase type 3 isoform X1 n=1 Tax=Pieris napi TaxID=78633 RepID=UPI001FBB6739|nr:adenylate cyclase type 3 isoform X1 [Pieris napi]
MMKSMKMEKSERSGLSRICICLEPPWSFEDPSDEKLYLAYTQRQRQGAVLRWISLGILLQIFIALVPGEANLKFAYASVVIGTVLNLSLVIVYAVLPKVRPLLNHIAWLVLWIQLLVSTSRRVGDSYNELLGWAIVLQYFTLTTLPFHHLLLIVYSVISFTAFLLVQSYNATVGEVEVEGDVTIQQVANGCLLLGATLLGGTAYFINERKQRLSFKETKRSLRDKLTIEQQSKEQERLLLSVLPEHVAVKMRADLGCIDTQFKKIYMSRHENVSILYADIVGFTAISSSYSAQDLVAILNELFARFDRLAEKYNQLRIKILGDCYYCISGAPVERPDHAVLCVHMGLSMVKAIKYVQRITNSPVDMRVGIHTGAVLAGVLGQRQWQFDVYSRDVELANKMESSGMAGRVHVSEVTRSFLKDEFEVEPAHGERREEMLRQAGIKTYFIVKYKGSEEKCNEGETGGSDWPDVLSDLKDDDEDSVISPQDETHITEEIKIHTMLQEELVNRDDDRELADGTTICLTFKENEIESGYAQRGNSYPQAIGAPPMIILPALTPIITFAVPSTWTFHAFYIALVLEACALNILYLIIFRYAQYKNKKIPTCWKLACGIFNIAVFLALNVIPLIVCGFMETNPDEVELNEHFFGSRNQRCLHTSYYYHMGVGVACSVLWVRPLREGYRLLLLTGVAAAHALPAALYPALLDRYRPPFAPYLNTTGDPTIDLMLVVSQIHPGRHILMMFIIIIGLVIYHRYSESVERARYSRGVRMRGQAEQARELRRRNEALVHNVLPPHVATHFMGARHHHRDLYSQSYAEVGVLFASMPNFTEFYSEETVNNQGLECLRFLNEVISDFDLLLEESKFSKDIIKIKTISSTYMAASGLNPTRQMQPTDGTLVRWAHLACLVEFALELQRVLAAINEQSFNHFVLRMGVNHGPITAGVIGARKPHYDIWGNTVNVASRMESTGKAGCIQVTEETCEILQKFGYYFEQRGLVAVKGKGQLMTYYLLGKRENGNPDCPMVEESAEADAGDALLANGTTSTSHPTAQTPASHDEVERPLLN